jgi:endonuclease/exonuclease/phosphatase family metal-dependent hydrolase
MGFRILTWNILAQATLTDEQSSQLPWSKRLAGILKIILESNLDFILLQEVDLYNFEKDFAQLITKYEYERHHIIKTGKNKRTISFGNVTLWRLGRRINSFSSSRCLHVEIEINNTQSICLTNVHFPAKPGFEGYKEKKNHLVSCIKYWQQKENIIFGGDFNDSLSYQDAEGKTAGLALDISQLGFVILKEELEKKTCKSFRGNIHNLDHILVRGSLTITLKLDISHVNINDIPNSIIPSDHLPMCYEFNFPIHDPSTEITIGLDVDIEEPDDFLISIGHIRELNICLCKNMISSLRDIIISYMKCTAMLQSNIAKEFPIEIIAPYLAFRSQAFQMKLETNDSIYYLDFSPDSIRLMVLYIHVHRLGPLPLIVKPLRYNEMSKNTTCLFDVWFCEKCDSKKDQLQDVLMLANYLGIENLINLLCAKMATKIRGGSFATMEININKLSCNIPEMPPHCTCPAH